MRESSLANCLKSFFINFALRKKAFTLAEVLITLTIIGVVSAITVPNLKNKVDTYIYRGGLKKAYSILKNAHRKSIADGENFYDEVKAQTINAYYWDNPENIKDYFKVVNGPYLGSNGGGYKALSTLYGAQQWQHNSGLIKDLNGKASEYWRDSSAFAFQVADGMIIAFHITHCHAQTIYIDVNGAKGPNTFGKDLFLFNYADSGHANGAAENSPVSQYEGIWHQILPQGSKGTQSCGGNIYFSPAPSDCNSKGTGYTCAREYLQNMSYKVK